MLVENPRRGTMTALALGLTIIFLSVAGALTLTFPTFSAYYFSAAVGLSLVAAGLISMIEG